MIIAFLLVVVQTLYVLTSGHHTCLISPERYNSSLEPDFTGEVKIQPPGKGSFVSDLDKQNLVVGEWTWPGGGHYEQLGRVLIYHETVQYSWSHVLTLNHPEPGSQWSIRFGADVAIHNQVMVAGAFEMNGKRGAAWVYRETAVDSFNWALVTKLVAAIEYPQAHFGAQVDVYNDRVLVSADHRYAPVHNDTGLVYVFEESAPALGDYTLTSVLNASDGANEDKFGYDIQLDGLNFIVGAPGHDINGFNGFKNTGAAYIFHEILPQQWVEVATLKLSDGEGYEAFGHAVAMSGQSAAVGAYLDRYVSAGPGGWNGEDNMGSVSMYHEAILDSGIWEYRGKLVLAPPIHTPSWNDFFGRFIDMDNDLLVIGANNVDTFYEELDGGLRYINIHGVVVIAQQFPSNSGNWTVTDMQWAHTPLDSQEFGKNALSISGHTIVAQTAKEEFNTTTNVYDPGTIRIKQIECGDDCIGNMCANNATCTDMYKAYSCQCVFPWESKYCTEHVCLNGAVPALDKEGNWFCDCTDTGHVGATCEKLCKGGGVVDPRNGFTACNCTHPVETGNEGKYCNKDIDDCASSPCMNNGICTDDGALWFPNAPHEYNCTCLGPFNGKNCETSECESSDPCLNGGNCEIVDSLVGLVVACDCNTTGYEGSFCESETDECSSSPCLNAGVCIDDVKNFTCLCLGTGYKGNLCSIDIDDCASSPCASSSVSVQSAVCQDKGANAYKCSLTCVTGYTGKDCDVNIDDCLLTEKECLNGGACTDDPVNIGDVLCDCSTSTGGFTGKYCDVPIENACVTFNPCFNGSKCLLDEFTNAMSCDCTDTGYEGDVCHIQVYDSECVSSPCLNAGQCYDPSEFHGDWYCECGAGYFGAICDLQACDSMPCQNSGTCANDMEGGYVCACTENYSGAQCQENEDEQVQQGSSSSSSFSTKSQEDPVLDEDDTAKNAPIIIIIVLCVVVGAIFAGGFFFYKKNQSTKSFAMPT